MTKKESETRYWLFKSEPEAFSISDLEKAKGKTTFWDGVRNYQARNFLRDEVKPGDGVIFYHSNAEPPSIVGLAKVVKEGYPDHTAFEKDNIHYDPKSKKTDPTWFMVDIQHIKTFGKAISLGELKSRPQLKNMVLLQKGSRLSIQPVTSEEWQLIQLIGDGDDHK